MNIIVKFLVNSSLKQGTGQKSSLSPDNYFDVAKEGEIVATEVLIAENNHYKIKVSPTINSKTTWYVFQDHVRLLDMNGKVFDVDKYDIPNLDTTSPQSGVTTVPDIAPTVSNDTVFILGVGQVSLSSPITSKGNFTWSEATHGGTRLPQYKEHTDNIIKVATLLQPYRTRLNREFNITSWYRPEPFNSAAGGATNSTHLYGQAVDFWVDGFTREQLYDYFDPTWTGGLGLYPNLQIIHVDCRSYVARWFGMGT